MKKIRVGGAILILLTLLSLLFMGRGEIDSSLRSAPPTLSHILGCDTLGRDLLERIGGGVVVSLSISIFTSLLSVFLALVLVAVAINSEFLSSLLLTAVTAFKSIPTVLVALLLSSLWGGKTSSCIIALTITGTASSLRVLMVEAREIYGEDYMTALDALGIKEGRKRIFHLVPGLFPYAREEWATIMMSAILTESSLSFLGVGIDPSIPSLGSILAEGRPLILTRPHIVIFSSLGLLIIGGAITLISRGLSELDPTSH